MSLARPARNNAVIVTVLVLAALIVGFFVWQRVTSTRASGTTIDVSNQPFLGNADAKVTVVVFEDFKCPNCKNFEENVYPTIKEKFIDTNRIRFAFVNFPFLGPDSTTAAVAAECAYQQSPQAFWQYKTIIYRGQKEETTQWATPAYLQELAGYVNGLDAAQLSQCIASNATIEKVNADNALARRLNVGGTPTVFVNGVQVQARTFDDFTTAIDRALQNAR
ncbi:DsbA family protein [Deinococcus yavapaiensis]|uniref:Protein-disulfide isomerase n=1 Tax=Deinococcus yavapaiensis KR-236 TaxID=694435 RepID=A0A318SCR3_9DEIO|nr:DsbA family protein [Deinococcus yavapaiensis]PYE56661.1 protein-disulfide isomerase [Deinococcus yavapaiensis KR-236]